jgi:hypothetical protein
MGTDKAFWIMIIIGAILLAVIFIPRLLFQNNGF